jgi:superfamily II DNA/RNA helicase
MYDPETAKMLRSAPEFPDLNPNDLPKLLTNHYAQIISLRLNDEEKSHDQDNWTLDKIADSYELMVSLSDELSIKRPSAFVAASAQLIIARREELINDKGILLPNISRDRLAPEISAVLLFLIAEQYADAHEAASKITVSDDESNTIASLVTRYVIDLAMGNLSNIISCSQQRVEIANIQMKPNESSAFLAMLSSLASAIESMAKIVLGIFEEPAVSPLLIFEKVKALSAISIERNLTSRIELSYPGIQHLSSLLITVFNTISEASLTNLAAPDGSTPDFWRNWISFRAKKFPYIWPNHRRALDAGFHKSGVSAVLVLPTGAGKTTVSSIKIANILSQGKKVIFLAPTHALVEQLTTDLQEMFPKDILGSSVSSDFDLLFQVGSTLPEIEVMTPERCLAMLSFSPDSFEDVGLLVFDECHLLSPQSGKIRRSLDSMLCLLAFNKIAPNADALFLSAMVKNGKELSNWITQLTNRECISIDLLWKPSRQARGVVIYPESSINDIKTQAMTAQRAIDVHNGKPAKGLRTQALKLLKTEPYAIWGLQHNWLDMVNNNAECTFTKLSENKVALSGSINSYGLSIKPNVNVVSAKIAEMSAVKGLKTIVFVNQKSHAISTSRNISKALGYDIESTGEEDLRWEALALELGDIKHSLLTKGHAAVPHNASMLRIERDLSERLYKRADGAMVIVATPTLAQGLNLPAQLAILAGDKRAEVESGGRELLEAHELLNAAARAGRAGHLANGIVLLIPEPVLTFPENHSLNGDVVQKLQSLIPEDDRCVEISDPLEVILDRISAGETLDRDVSYLVNRLATLNEANDNENTLFNLEHSFAAYRSRIKGDEQRYLQQVRELTHLVEREAADEIDEYLSILASQSGLPPQVLLRLKLKISTEVGHLPESIETWIIWLVSWLKADIEARDVLLFDVQTSILGSVGRNKNEPLSNEALDELIPGIISWISGQSISDVDRALGGNPYSSRATAKSCPRARELVSTVLPRGFSFIMGLITRVVTEVHPYKIQESLSSEVVEALSPAIRLGYDSQEKLSFSFANPRILSRVGMHRAFSAV